MFEATLRLLLLLEKTGKIYGRKKLQKIVYLLDMMGGDFPFKFEYYHFGPYSAQLQTEINNMVEQGFLSENTNDEAYEYEVTSEGVSFQETIEDFYNYTYEFNFPPEKLTLLLKQNSQFLEMVSTIAYLVDSGYSDSDAKEKAEELKPHLKRLSNEALEFYHQLFQ